MPFSRMFNDVRTSVPVNQVALMTSLQTHFGCSLTGRTGWGDDIADLLEDAIDFMAPLKYEDLWSETLLRHLPSELATQARVLDPNADHVALEREARSALTEALPHIMETYDLLADHSVPASMQGELIDALLAELEEGVERETAPVTPDLRTSADPVRWWSQRTRRGRRPRHISARPRQLVWLPRRWRRRPWNSADPAR